MSGLCLTSSLLRNTEVPPTTLEIITMSSKNKYHIYPDYWLPKCEAPYLGTVYADDEFEATRRVYDKGFLPVNTTFGPRAVPVDQSARPPFQRHRSYRN